MTNHIEQMMKAAGIEPVYSPIECLHCDDKGFCPHAKALISKGIGFKYPSFTSAKQLELIKLICKSRNICELSIHLVPYGAGEDFWFQKVTYFKEQKCYMDKEPVLVAASKFENVLAELTIELIKSNELDKAEVKRILEDD